ncbi:hypothetical protein HALLA_04535 (plasmid) [Halostagnicola larsenii XH-48]|uniref:Uncharacterized protein n=1 Tax=Halostagnicola larsenii XH-48 TaxID=797299 RepID=W0JWI2_9EURY|nr:hypothetical protein HALLA_04535 [Halostagnicola larsenii XH-48]
MIQFIQARERTQKDPYDSTDLRILRGVIHDSAFGDEHQT